MKIVFATNNEHKLSEVRAVLNGRVEILSLDDIGCHDDIPETGLTLEENAMQKARYIHEKYGMSVFADDTGLEVEALGGQPGVYTARYSVTDCATGRRYTEEEMAAKPWAKRSMVNGEMVNDHDTEGNIRKLLCELDGVENRRARFRTVIALIDEMEGGALRFEGVCEGEIVKEKSGGEGFGYDPIFRPDGYNGTFAELGVETKNKISHRAKAVERLVGYLWSL